MTTTYISRLRRLVTRPFVRTLAAAMCSQGALVSSTATMTPLQAQSVATAVRICGVDRTLSVGEGQRLLEQCADVVRFSQPGDLVEVRWISDKSYDSRERLVVAALPEIGPACGPYSGACRVRRRELMRHFLKARDSLVAVVQRAEARQAPRTDVRGFLARAADLFEQRPGSRHVLYLTGDLGDNLGRDAASLRLRGAVVVIIDPVTSFDAAGGQQILAKWRSTFLANGASSVHVVLSAQEPIR